MEGLEKAVLAVGDRVRDRTSPCTGAYRTSAVGQELPFAPQLISIKFYEETMSYHLSNRRGEDFYFSTISWAFYLNLANIYYDWKKAGTLAPVACDKSGEPWQGAYDWNTGQIVTTEDAKALAASLEAWLNDEQLHEKANELAKGLSEALSYEITFDHSDVGHIQSFINFARRGQFEIW